MPALLTVENLQTYFYTYHGIVKAVDGITYHINPGEIVGLVGESGCGKSVSQFSVLQLIPVPPGKIVGGKIIFDGQDLLKIKADSAEMRSIRGTKISMIYQEPMTCLNPTLTICRQLTECLEEHLRMTPRNARQRAIELLKMVNIPDAETRIDDYPHQFSGGMRQRVMIAMALSCNPKLLIADEPTTALDVTIQAQILELIEDMVKRLNISLVVVTHNLGLVTRYAQRIYVMYSGRIIESGNTKDIISTPVHPYTKGLLSSVPSLDEETGRKLIPIQGMPSNLINMPVECAFLPRCSCKTDKCEKAPWPELRQVRENHYVSCFLNQQETSCKT